MKKGFNRHKRVKGPPRWDLKAIYTDIAGQDLLDDRQEAEELSEIFESSYKDSVAYLSGIDLGAAIAEYEQIETILRKAASYAALLEAEDHANYIRTQPLKKWISSMEDKLLFFTREIGDMKEVDLMTKLIAPDLAQYAPWIAQQRVGHHRISGDVETVSNHYETVNTEAWKRLYVETMGGIKVDDKGAAVSFEELEKRIVAEGTPAAVNAEIRQKMAVALKRESKRVAYIYNVLIQDMAIDSDLKKFQRPDHGVHLENGLDSSVVDTMFSAVKTSFTHLSQRYYAWRVAKSGNSKVKISDFLEMPSAAGEGNEVFFSWDESRRLVLRAFRKFSPVFSRIAQKFFDEKHIDAVQRDNRETNPFTMPVGPGNLPFILVNFEEDLGSVTSYLGHELGHGIHQVLVEKAQGLFLSNISTDVAETASIFAETLVFEELLQGQKDPKARQWLLEERVSNMLGNALQQLSYYDFERRVHAERKNGELSAEKISDIWLETQREYYGPSIELDEYERYSWMTVSHFFEMPFYVHSYSFAQMVVSALFQEYKKAQQQGPESVEQFTANYIELLETGSTRNFYEMFEPFGLDPEQAELWKSSLSLIDQYLNELIQYDDPAPVPQDKPSAPPPSFSP